MLDKNIIRYWKRSSFIVLLAFILMTTAIILAVLNISTDAAFFLGYLQSSDALKSLGSIASIVGAIAGYLYLLFYMEQHNAFILKESTKEAKITIEAFMLFRMVNYLVPVLVVYLVLVAKAYLYAGIVLAPLAITELVFKPITRDFTNILYNYKSLEALEPTNLTTSLQKNGQQAKSDMKNIMTKVKDRNRSQPFLRTILLPYKDYVPAWLYGTVWIIIKQGGPHVKNSIALLTFLTVFIMLPAGLTAVNVVVVAYIVLTLLYWFWTSSVAFSGLPEGKLNVKLKDGKLYEKVYCIEDNPEGYHLYLNAENTALKVLNNELEKEMPILATMQPKPESDGT